ncbi:hypothetical protein DM01DRAFT_1323039 [Hesseltinella vesiculosa]|uniref:Myb-like domain-containing protein n=1 Tax=Hesseltinella vesiculosa TaxID=101127 RepID=A0A1X2GGS7_9FUNG|nr:hypothetical protein DM01DRAFT_1323039 [Hesseltinella vesiculosa]
MSRVMDIKHLLCQTMDIEQQRQQLKEYVDPLVIQSPQEATFIEQIYDDVDAWKHARSMSSSSLSTCSTISSRSNSISSQNSSPRQRSQSEHHRTSPLISYYQQPHHYAEALVAPLTTSMSTTILSSPPHRPSPHARQRHRSCSTSNVHTLMAASSLSSTPMQTRTPWTPAEDELLQKGFEQGLSWAMISSTYLPHRSRGCCWGRFKTLQSKNLIDFKFQQQSRLARRPWKTMDGRRAPC